MTRPFSSRLSALTPENVPTPPAAAQAPELSPFETEMPLPPSTSGSTSRPEIFNGFNAINSLLLERGGRRRRASSNENTRTAPASRSRDGGGDPLPRVGDHGG